MQLRSEQSLIAGMLSHAVAEQLEGVQELLNKSLRLHGVETLYISEKASNGELLSQNIAFKLSSLASSYKCPEFFGFDGKLSNSLPVQSNVMVISVPIRNIREISEMLHQAQ